MTSRKPRPQGRWVGNTLADFERDLADNLCYQRGTTAESASLQDAYWTLAVTVRDRLADRRVRTARANYEANPKFVYYLSAEYMLGRQLRQNTLYTGPPGWPARPWPRPGTRPGSWRSSTSSRGWATAASAGWPPACSTRWPPWTCRRSATASGMSSASSGRPSTMASRSSCPTTGLLRRPVGVPAPETCRSVGFDGHTEAVDDDQGGRGPAGYRVERAR